ncbi:alpha/beta fold hydrolase [Diaphorobacter caeni]|uniref:alpha/beta fold hydrolase n=1 Tax=Diaphorobacter caeni TaxID=2784387 RepID=UPI0018907EAF|nr:alpha/beta hydrolase [Diaphorobacter caeni]MBF5004421.1 alpha/beta hydrolase [Diaphorobacter caeni]
MQSNELGELFPNFQSHFIAVDGGVHIHALTGGEGPPLLLLHGHPQTSAIWHKVAPELAKHFSLVLADLRGYGDSSKPNGGARSVDYSKRVMASDMVQVMRHLGHDRFRVMAHDRGARVAHRLALDHAGAVERLVLMDIAPTLAMYSQTTEAFARAYWHWFFLIQKSPLPERLINSNPSAYVREVMGGRSAGLSPFDLRALAEYERCVSLPGTAHAICEDYRASADIDLQHDREDIAAGHALQAPTLVLWGEEGVVNRCFEPLKEWQKISTDVRGHTVPCGHYIAEEAPEALLASALPFLKGS